MDNVKLLIDSDCPMCGLYGKAFVKTGLLTSDGISSYQSCQAVVSSNVDMDRARNEIALYDASQKTTVYGPDALLTIATQKFPQLLRLFQWGPIRFLISQCYNFISYNRKIIYPVALDQAQTECRPDYHAFYRWSFILVVAFVTGLILNSFTLEIAHGLGINHIWWREYLICFGQIAWQFSVVALFDKSKGMEYLGNMSTVSFVGGLLLIPVLYLESQFNLGLYYLIPAFLAVVLFMFFEHIRRCKILKLPLGMTASWIAYRVFVLAIIIAVSYFSF